MKRPRIAEIGKYYAPVTGGIENYVRQCAQVLIREFDVKVICMRRGAGRSQEDLIDGLPVFRTASLGSIWRQEIPCGLGEALARWRPDVIHFHAPNPLVAALLGNWSERAKLVVTHHSDLIRPPPFRQLAWRYYRRLLEAASAIIVFTQTYADNSSELAAYRDKVVVVPHGVDSNEFRRRGPWTRVRRIGFLGRLEKWKGLDLLLAIAERRTDLEVHIAGSGSYGPTLAKAIARSGLEKRIILHGEVTGERRTAFLTELDLLALPSLHAGESFGIVLVEAQLCGVPVVVSDLPTGVSEVAAHGKFGWTFTTGNVDSLLAVIDLLDRDPGLVASVIERAYHNAVERYTKPAVEAKLLEVFRRITAATSAEKRP